jgi:hypothetical protein
MEAGDVLGQAEFAIMSAVHRGGLRTRLTVRKVPGLNGWPAEEAMLHEVLHRCERNGLLRSERDAAGRRYELTQAGRTRLRADRRFRLALAGLLVRGPVDPV